MRFKLPELPYAYNALEPYIDEKTMSIHHTKHHQGYTDKLNGAIENTSLENKRIEDILKNIAGQPDTVRNNGGGYYNHSLFWKILTPDGSEKPEKDLTITEALTRNFGSFEDFRDAFKEKALNRFGSGWAWLIMEDSTQNLSVTSTANQDNPLMNLGNQRGTPILGLDVWEHAYYLKYQNRRAEYIDNFFKVINWEYVNQMYEEVLENEMAGAIQ